MLFFRHFKAVPLLFGLSLIVNGFVDGLSFANPRSLIFSERAVALHVADQSQLRSNEKRHVPGANNYHDTRAFVPERIPPPRPVNLPKTPPESPRMPAPLPNAPEAPRAPERPQPPSPLENPSPPENPSLPKNPSPKNPSPAQDPSSPDSFEQLDTMEETPTPENWQALSKVTRQSWLRWLDQITDSQAGRLWTWVKNNGRKRGEEKLKDKKDKKDGDAPREELKDIDTPDSIDVDTEDDDSSDSDPPEDGDPKSSTTATATTSPIDAATPAPINTIFSDTTTSAIAPISTPTSSLPTPTFTASPATNVASGKSYGNPLSPMKGSITSIDGVRGWISGSLLIIALTLTL